MLLCADGKSASEASPKARLPDRCLLTRETVLFDMEVRNKAGQTVADPDSISSTLFVCVLNYYIWWH